MVTTKWHNVACVECGLHWDTHTHSLFAKRNFQISVLLPSMWGGFLENNNKMIDSTSLEWMCACSDFDIRFVELCCTANEYFVIYDDFWMYSHRRDFRIMDFKGLEWVFGHLVANVILKFLEIRFYRKWVFRSLILMAHWRCFCQPMAIATEWYNFNKN